MTTTNPAEMDLTALVAGGWVFAEDSEGWHGVNQSLGLRTHPQARFPSREDAARAAEALERAQSQAEVGAAAGKARGSLTVESALKALLLTTDREREIWAGFRQKGAGDSTLLNQLKTQIGKSRVWSGPEGVCQINAKPKLGLWVGSYGVGLPSVPAKQLLARIRDVMAVPKLGESPAAAVGAPLPQTRGYCRVCNRTDDEVGDGEYGWADETYTLCSSCRATMKQMSLTEAELREKLRADRGSAAQVATVVSAPEADESSASAEDLAEAGSADQGTYGVCSICGCTQDSACLDASGEPCWWANTEHTLCSRCDTDRASELAVQEPVVEQLSLFDYGALRGEDAAVVRKCTHEIQVRVQSIQQHTIEIGERLEEVKSRLDWGQFNGWLAVETPFSRDTADRLIQVAEFARNSPQLAENLNRFTKSALYVLVAPSTPESVREEAITRAQEGETLTPAKMAEIRERHEPRAETETETETKRGDGALQADLWSKADESISRSDYGLDKPVAERITTGSTVEDLAALLKGKAEGLHPDDLKRTGFAREVIERANTAKRIEQGTDGKCRYRWTVNDVVELLRAEEPLTLLELEEKGVQRSAITAAEMDGVISRAKDNGYRVAPLKRKAEGPRKAIASLTPAADPKRIEELAKGKTVFVSFMFMPALPGKVTLGVRVGENVNDTSYVTIDSTKVKLPGEALDLIKRPVPKTSKPAVSKVRGALKPAKKKSIAGRKTAPKKPVSKSYAKAKPAKKKGRR